LGRVRPPPARCAADPSGPRACELVANYHKRFLGLMPAGETLDLPMSLQLTEALRAMGVDEF
jgi:hypothetical protein